MQSVSLLRREALPLIDLTASSAQLVQQLGEPASRELYMIFAPGLYPNYPEGKTDNTHLRNPGAVAFAGLVGQGAADPRRAVCRCTAGHPRA